MARLMLDTHRRMSAMRAIVVSLLIAGLALSGGCQRQSARSPEECIRRDRQPTVIASRGDDPIGTRTPDERERSYFKDKDQHKNELKDMGKEFELPDCPPEPSEAPSLRIPDFICRDQETRIIGGLE
jgi:hypothetical protein